MCVVQKGLSTVNPHSGGGKWIQVKEIRISQV